MKKLLTLILVLCSVVGSAQMRGGAQYDPGAARANLSNVDAAATPSMTSITLSGKVKAAWADILGDIYASGTVKVSTGTAAAPAYSFASDPNTGMYSPAADNLGVSVAGAAALRVNSAGEMLIATSTDAGNYKLQVNGNTVVYSGLSQSATSFVAALPDGSAITLNGAVGVSTEIGKLTVVVTSNGTAGYADYFCNGITTKEITDANDYFTVSKDTAGKINIYFESGDLFIQNRTGGSFSAAIIWVGYKN